MTAPIPTPEGSAPAQFRAGLYQAARHAETSGYALTLAENRDGAVCFALAKAGA